MARVVVVASVWPLIPKTAEVAEVFVGGERTVRMGCVLAGSVLFVTVSVWTRKRTQRIAGGAVGFVRQIKCVSEGAVSCLLERWSGWIGRMPFELLERSL
jgi:hypothetical protein